MRYAQRELNKLPSELRLEDFDSAFIGEFLSHLEYERRNRARSRNLRLTAIRSFFRHVALHERNTRPSRNASWPCRANAISARPWPGSTGTKSRPCSAPRTPHPVRPARPDPAHRGGATGLRASELIGLRCRDVQLGAGAHLRCHGKGRKERHTPLRRDAAAMLKAWLKERGDEPGRPRVPESTRSSPEP